MAIREVLLYPHPALKQVAAPVQPPDVERVSRDLLETMGSFPGCVGIAAPQIDEPVRMIAVDVSGHRKAETSNGLLVLANPRVAEVSGEAEVAREGCLSIPDMTANVRRATRVAIEHSAGRVEAEGFEARCLLHEIDHLDGVLFLDRVASLVDDVFRRKNYGPPPSEPGTGSSSGGASERTG